MNRIFAFQPLYLGHLFGDGCRNTALQFFGCRHDLIQLIKVCLGFVTGIGRFLRNSKKVVFLILLFPFEKRATGNSVFFKSQVNISMHFIMLDNLDFEIVRIMDFWHGSLLRYKISSNDELLYHRIINYLIIQSI